MLSSIATAWTARFLRIRCICSAKLCLKKDGTNLWITSNSIHLISLNHSFHNKYLWSPVRQSKRISFILNRRFHSILFLCMQGICFLLLLLHLEMYYLWSILVHPQNKWWSYWRRDSNMLLSWTIIQLSPTVYLLSRNAILKMYSIYGMKKCVLPNWYRTIYFVLSVFQRTFPNTNSKN